VISEAALQEFKEIWLAQFGAVIPDDVAVEEATNLLTMFDAIYRPLKQEWIDEYEDENGTNK